MRRCLFLFCLCFVCVNLCAQETFDRPFIYAGMGIRIDKNAPLELDLKYLQQNYLSGGLRFATFDYIEREGAVHVGSVLSGIKNHVSFDYAIKGFTLKPGWIPFKRLKPRSIMSMGLYGVATRAQHEFSFIFSDVAGETRETYTHTQWNYGAEVDFHLGLRLFQRVNLGISYILGYKLTNVPVFETQVKGMNTYSNYTPVQGYGSSPYYVMATATLGVNF